MKDLAIALDNRPGALADQLILVVDDIEKARAVAQAWMSERA
jgi:hypothetical protein